VHVRTRRGHDWTPRFPQIVEAAVRLSAASLVLDGEGVILRSDGVLRSHRHDHEVQLPAFDLLELDGADLRTSGLTDAGRDWPLLRASQTRHSDHRAP
jgi:ATP-dependent DNA ligase